MTLMKVNKLRRRWATLLIVALLLWCAAPALADGARDVLKVGVPVDRCPMFYLDDDSGEIVGIGVDLMRTAGEAAGYRVRFLKIGEPTLKEALDNRDYDVIMPFGSAIDSASGHPSVVTENLIRTPFTLLTVGKRVLPPLKKLRVGMLRSQGGVAETMDELYPGIEIAMYASMADSVKALRRGEVDALLQNSYVWSYVLQKPAYSDLTVQPEAMFSMDFRAGGPDTPECRAVIDRLNRGIAALTDTRRQAIVLDHTSRKLYRYTLSDYIYQYGLVLLLTVLLFAALAAIAVMRLRALRRQHAEKLRQLIDHDPLTGTLSMSGFRKRVEALLRANPDIPYTLSYNNICNFKFINDSLGMAAGDELLRFWAKRVMETLSTKEAIGRIGADHFAVLRCSRGEEQLQRDNREVLEPVRHFFVNQGKNERVQLCSGIYVLMPEDYRQPDVDHLLDYARVAEKRARKAHKDGLDFYNPEEWERGKRVAEVVSHLPDAIRDGELRVWYQPQVDFETGRITGAEALCRWKHNRLGWLSPADFIPALEESGLIFQLDSYVWETVCRDLQRWNAQGWRRCASVNLSRSDIRQERDIPGYFRDLVKIYGLDPDQLHIEITETAFAENSDLLLITTRELRKLGFTVEMDDFGSGYSSLHMLKAVQVDRIKLDLNFLTNAGDAEKGRVILSYVIQMIRALGMKLIAEGVEEEAQARFLSAQGCGEMQGYYFYKPMPVEDFEEIMG